MKRFITYLTYVSVFTLLMLFLCSCASESAANTSSTEAMILQTESETFPAPPATDPPVPTDPTEPPEPTIPPLYIAAGAYFDSYHSDTYDDYLDFYVHVPEQAVENMPLVVYLHGDGEVNKPHNLPPYGLSVLTKKAYGEAFPFILLEPNTRIKSWTSGNIPELLIELIKNIAERYCVNTDKIIITGHSRGAIGVWDMISIYGNYFSAAVPVSSPHQKGHIDYLKAAEVPVWTFAGDEGDIERWYHQYLAKNVEMINVSGGFGKFTILKGCDHGEAKEEAYVRETFDWMLAQVRGVIPEEE